MSDVKTFLRLKGAIEAAEKAIPEGQIAAAGDAYKEAYLRFRPLVREAIPQKLEPEFDASFPSNPHFPQRTRAGGRLLAAGTSANEARALLASLAGWVDGVIQSELIAERMKLEAEAYAKERVREERGVDVREMGEK